MDAITVTEDLPLVPLGRDDERLLERTLGFVVVPHHAAGLDEEGQLARDGIVHHGMGVQRVQSVLGRRQFLVEFFDLGCARLADSVEHERGRVHVQSVHQLQRAGWEGDNSQW